MPEPEAPALPKIRLLPSNAPEDVPRPGYRKAKLEREVEYDSKEDLDGAFKVPKKIHIIGLGAIGKLIAHSLRTATDPPLVTLISHRRGLYNEWEKSSKIITLQQDGFRSDAYGCEMECVRTFVRAYGMIVQDPDFIWSNPDGLRPNEAAEEYRKKQVAQEQIGELPELSENDGLDPEIYRDDPIHNLIFTVKGPRTIGALLSVKHRLLPTSTICFMQNGMGIIDQVNEHVFPDPATRPNYLQGIITHGVNAPRGSSPFYAIHAGQGTIALGVPPREEDKDIRDEDAPVPFADTTRYLLRTLTRLPILAAVGIPPTEFLCRQLEKLAQNAVVNPLTVLMDARNGSLLYNFALTGTMRLLLGEISLVIRSLPELKGLPNIRTRFSATRLETLVVGIANRTANNVSSMLADVRYGNNTEIDFINGYIVKRGEELGIQCVTNFMVMHLVKGKNAIVKRELLQAVPFEEPDSSTGEMATGEKDEEDGDGDVLTRG